MKSLNTSDVYAHEATRQQLASDVEAFLAAGGTVKQVQQPKFLKKLEHGTKAAYKAHECRCVACVDWYEKTRGKLRKKS